MSTDADDRIRRCQRARHPLTSRTVHRIDREAGVVRMDIVRHCSRCRIQVEVVEGREVLIPTQPAHPITPGDQS